MLSKATSVLCAFLHMNIDIFGLLSGLRMGPAGNLVVKFPSNFYYTKIALGSSASWKVESRKKLATCPPVKHISRLQILFLNPRMPKKINGLLVVLPVPPPPVTTEQPAQKANENSHARALFLFGELRRSTNHRKKSPATTNYSTEAASSSQQIQRLQTCIERNP